MSRKKKIFITAHDHSRLEDIFHSAFVEAYYGKPYLADLRTEIDAAEIVESEDLPVDVVTMHSTVRLRDMLTKEEEIYTLVYPEEANIAEGKISILAPIGTAILGYQVGDTVRWKVPSGLSRWRIEEVIVQPERKVAEGSMSVANS